MIGYQGPAKTEGFRVRNDVTQAFYEIVPVLIIRKYPPALDSSNNNMVQCTGGLPAIASRSGEAGGHRFWLWALRAVLYTTNTRQ